MVVDVLFLGACRLAGCGALVARALLSPVTVKSLGWVCLVSPLGKEPRVLLVMQQTLLGSSDSKSMLGFLLFMSELICSSSAVAVTKGSLTGFILVSSPGELCS